MTVQLIKNANGQDYLLGTFTNRFQDREGQIITNAAHEEYIEHLKANPNEMPELQFWHMAKTTHTSKAVWAAYDGAFVNMLWPMTSEEVAGFNAVKERYPKMGMSHGFEAKIKGTDIVWYRTSEASFLPLEKAANYFTEVQILEDSTMAMSDQDMEKLAAFVSLEVAKGLSKGNDVQAEALETAGVLTKEATEEPEPVPAEASEQEPSNGDYITRSDFETALTSIMGMVNDLTEENAQLKSQMKAMADEKKATEEKAMPITYSRDYLRSLSQSVASNGTSDVAKTLAKSKPMPPIDNGIGTISQLRNSYGGGK